MFLFRYGNDPRNCGIALGFEVYTAAPSDFKPDSAENTVLKRLEVNAPERAGDAQLILSTGGNDYWIRTSVPQLFQQRERKWPIGQ